MIGISLEKVRHFWRYIFKNYELRNQIFLWFIILHLKYFFPGVTIEGFEYVAFYECCTNKACRKKLEFEDEEKDCPYCETKIIKPGRGMRFVLLIDDDGETRRLQGFMNSIESYLPQCDEKDMEEKLNEIFEGKNCKKITYR